MSRKRVVTEECRYCGAAIREAQVLVGRPPGEKVRLMIDREPHRDGRVIKRKDQQYRLLGDSSYKKPGVPAFRVHGRTILGCGVQAAQLAEKIRREIAR